jgi:SAM-dependent methyltransferase
LYAREKLGVPVKTGFAKQTNKTESFDIVTLYHVLEHMADPLVELENIWNILKREGFLVIEVPNAEDLKQDPKNRYHKAHLYTFNPETLIGLGQKAGFQAIRKKIEPLNGNISVIFQKKAKGIDRSIDLKSNYLRIMAILTTHNNKRHFLSVVPYKKFFQNMFEALSEQIKVRKFNSHKDIIDAVMSGQLK